MLPPSYPTPAPLRVRAQALSCLRAVTSCCHRLTGHRPCWRGVWGATTHFQHPSPPTARPNPQIQRRRCAHVCCQQPSSVGSAGSSHYVQSSRTSVASSHFSSEHWPTVGFSQERTRVCRGSALGQPPLAVQRSVIATAPNSPAGRVIVCPLCPLWNTFVRRLTVSCSQDPGILFP